MSHRHFLIAGLPHPSIVNGHEQQPIEGVSWFTHLILPMHLADTRQYFEILGNRVSIIWAGQHLPRTILLFWFIRSETWMTIYGNFTIRIPTGPRRMTGAEIPEKLRELQCLFLSEAARHNVLPLDDRTAERADPDRAGRPVLPGSRRQRLYPGIGRLNAFCVINTKNKSHRVTAEIIVPGNGCEGVIVAQGGFPGGWSLYTKEGLLKYCYTLWNRPIYKEC